MFKNLKTKKHEEKLLKNRDNINELVKECELLLTECKVPNIYEQVRVCKDAIMYMKLSENSKAIALEKKIHNLLGDLKIVINKEDRALSVTKEILTIVKQRDILA